MVRTLFVCVENANRSQMAEAFARRHGGALVEAASAGSQPGGRVSPRAVAGMAELGYDLTSQRSKSLEEVAPGPWDYVVTMGCGDGCPWVPSRANLAWDLPDPRDLPDAEFRTVRDEIERRVVELLRQVLAEGGEPA